MQPKQRLLEALERVDGAPLRWVSVADRDDIAAVLDANQMAFGDQRQLKVIFPETGEVKFYASVSVTFLPDA